MSIYAEHKVSDVCKNNSTLSCQKIYRMSSKTQKPEHVQSCLSFGFLPAEKLRQRHKDHRQEGNKAGLGKGED